jgi:prepilin-type N-terminal cleavage/methylation domain-containing protein
MNIKLSRGFTLIELLVVIAIISLLSSVVLAVVNDARDRAKAKAFREEISQFVNALELYRNDHGVYPGGELEYVEGRTHLGWMDTKGSAGYYAEFPSGYDYKNKLSPYIKKIPAQISYNVGDYENYCNEKISPYFIKVNTSEGGVEDWPFFFYGVDGQYSIDEKCFSLQ